MKAQRVCLCVRKQMYVLMHQKQPAMDDVMAGSGARLLILGVKDNLSTSVCEEDLCARPASVRKSAEDE